MSSSPSRTLMRVLFIALVASVLLAVPPLPAAEAQTGEGTQVLVFSETEAFRHGSIEAGVAALEQLGEDNGWVVDATEDSTAFTDDNLAQYDAVVFLSTTGDVLDAAQQAAFERYIQGGGGYAGIHAASDTEYDWPWYGELVGAYFDSHPPGTPTATVEVADHVHPSTDHLPARWERVDEWYDFQTNPRGDVHVLASMDGSSYSDDAMGADHPIAWCQDYDGGRSWYTGGGHTDASFSEPLFLEHLRDGILTAAGQLIADCGATAEDQFERTVVDDGTANPMKLDIADDGTVLYIEREGDVRVWDPEVQIPQTAGTLDVSLTHEDGLLGIAADPDFSENGWIYLYYSEPGAVTCPPTDPGAIVCGENVLSRFDLDVAVPELDLGSEEELLRVTTQRDECCHAGGALTFDDAGNLYLATGDNTNPFDSSGYTPIDERADRSSWDAQRTSGNTNDLRGKVLRITPQDNGTATIPEGNLFDEAADTGDETRPEIWAMGFRNPFSINWDSTHDRLTVGEYGPDANSANPNRGPEGRVEWLAVSEASNQGWPYCVSSNVAFTDYDFATSTSGAQFDCDAPVNESPNSTGLTDLPPAQPATLWWGYNANNNNVPVIGRGGAPMAGGVYEYAPDAGPDAFPEYYDGVAFLMEWNNNDIYEVHSDDDGAVSHVAPWLDDTTFIRPHDMRFGPDGAMYLIEWGSGFGGNNADSGIYRIGYTGGAFRPVAQIAATPDNGPAPLTVEFSSEGTEATAPEATIESFEWDFDGDGEVDSTDPNPTYVYTDPGQYTASLTVTDTLGGVGIASTTITAGNTRPVVTVTTPVAGGFVDFGDEFEWALTVTDAEDGAAPDGGIDCADVQVRLLLGHAEHAHALQNTTGCSGEFTTSRDGGHGVTENLFFVVEATYQDDPQGDAPSLSDNDIIQLQPKTRQAEHFDDADGFVETADEDAQGLAVVVGSAGDSFSFDPMNLVGIDTLAVRYRSTGDATLELRKGAPDGELAATVALPGSGGELQTTAPAAVADPGGTDSYHLVLTSGTDVAIDQMRFEGRGSAINAAPVVTAEATPTSGTAPLAVAFDGSAVDPDGDEVVDYEWDFGDGDTAPGPEATHTYDTPGEYTARLSATDARDATGYADVPITVEVNPEPPACLFPGSDEFEGTELDTGIWSSIVRPNPDDYVLEDGQLILTTSQGDLYQATNNAQNIILQPAPGQVFEITTQVTVNPTATYQQGGLIVYGDDDNYTKLDVVYNGNRIVEFLREVDGTPTAGNGPTLGAEVSTTLQLRIASDGTQMIGSYSTDSGETWVTVGQPSPIPADTQLGVFALTGNNTAPQIDAAFDWVRIDAPATEAPTVSDEFDGDSLDKCRWSVIVREDTTSYDVTDGNLVITSPDGDIYQTPNGTPTNFILQPIPDGDWEIETHVTAELVGRYQQAGLLAYVDDDQYVKFDIVAGAGAASGVARIELRSELGGVVQQPQPQVNLTNSEITLRLRREGGNFHGSYSVDGGETWLNMAQPVTNTALMESPDAAFGLFTLGAGQADNPPIDSFDAEFEYFRLLGEGGEDDTTPPEVQIELRGDAEGVVNPLPQGPQGISGSATLTRTDDGTAATIEVTGLTPNESYPSHLHAGTCTSMAGHYMDDPDGAPTPPNEIWLSSSQDPLGGLTANSNGTANGTGSATWIARTEPLSIMVHDHEAPGAPIACVNLDLTGPQTVIITADDGDGSGVATIEYQLDGGEWTTYEEPFTVSEPGEHTVGARATDVAGNTSDPVQATFTIAEEPPVDETPPVVSATLDPAPDENGEVVGDQVTVTLSASDPATDDVEVGDNFYDPTATSITTGDEVLWIWTGSESHNVISDTGLFASPSQTAGTYARTFDEPGAYPYFCGIHSLPGGQAQNGVITVSAPAGNDDDVAIEYRVDDPDGDWVAYDGPFDVAGPGEHTVEFRGTDLAGNTSDIESVTFTIVEPDPEDETAPTTTATLSPEPDGDGEVEGPVEVTLAADDGDGSGVASTEYRVDDPDGDWVAYDGPFEVAGAGEHTVEFRSTDVAGNVEEAKSVTFTIVAPDPEDETAPTTTATLSPEPDGDGEVEGPVEVTLAADDGDGSGVASTEYRVDDPDGDWVAYDGPFEVAGEGEHTVEFRSTDVAGNVEEAKSVTFAIVAPDPDPEDETAPTTTATLSPEPDGDGEVEGPVEVTLAADDGDGSGVASTEYRVDDPDGDWVAYDGPFEVAGEGEHTVEFRSTDVAGNVEEAKSVTFAIVAPDPDPDPDPTITPVGNDVDLTELGIQGDPLGLGELLGSWSALGDGMARFITDADGRICLIAVTDDGATTTVRCFELGTTFAQDGSRELSIPVSDGATLYAYQVESGALRIAGTDRVSTAVQTSRSGWDTSATVVLATADGFADALSAAPLAGQLDAPLLLTPSTVLDSRVLEEILRLGADRVVVMGGTAAVSDNVITVLTAADLVVDRIGGADRTETASLVAEEIGGAADGTAVVASGGTFADALAIAPIAAAQGLPIYLTAGDGLTDATTAAMAAHGVERVIIVGGTAAVGEGVESALADADVEIADRLGGATRYETAVAVLEWAAASGADLTELLVATGADFPDALTAGAYGGRTDRLVLLVEGRALLDGQPAEAFLSGTGADAELLMLLGGEAAIAAGLQDALGNALR